MFETALLERARGKRSPWSLMGLGVQIGLVGGMVLVPMLQPELLSVVLPKAVLVAPLRAAPPVVVRQASETFTVSNPALVAMPVRATKVFRAPTSWSNPVATLIDAAETTLAPFANATTLASSGYGGPDTAGETLGGITVALPPKPVPAVKASMPIRVGGAVQEANILSRTLPVYPPLAKQARISGRVRLEGVIAKDGTIQQLRVLSGHPLLSPAAVQAVKTWRYRPTLLNGEPVEVIAPIDVNFVLSN